MHRYNICLLKNLEITILKVVGCEDYVQDNNLPLWGLGGEAPSRWAILAIFQKKSSHFNAIWMTLLEHLEKATLVKWGPGGEAPAAEQFL